MNTNEKDQGVLFLYNTPYFFGLLGQKCEICQDGVHKGSTVIKWNEVHSLLYHVQSRVLNGLPRGVSAVIEIWDYKHNSINLEIFSAFRYRLNNEDNDKFFQSLNYIISKIFVKQWELFINTLDKNMPYSFGEFTVTPKSIQFEKLFGEREIALNRIRRYAFNDGELYIIYEKKNTKMGSQRLGSISSIRNLHLATRFFEDNIIRTYAFAFSSCLYEIINPNTNGVKL